MKRFMMVSAALVSLSAFASACGKGDNGGVVEPPPCDTGSCVEPPPPPTPPPPPPPPVTVTLAAAGNIASCNGNELATANVIGQMDATTQIIALGDNDRKPNTQGVQNYDNCYATSWGLFKDRTRAIVGNHEYNPATLTADGHATYWGANQGEPGKFWQAYDVGNWRVILLNVTDLSTQVGASYSAGSEQMLWLTNELATNQKQCTLVAMHNSPFLSSVESNFTQRNNVMQVFARLYNAGVDVVLAGNEHRYERFAPMDGQGNVDPARGVVVFNVGTGGESIERRAVQFTHPGAAERIANFGVLKLTLKDGGYDFQFLNTEAPTVTDSGSGTCH